MAAMLYGVEKISRRNPMLPILLLKLTIGFLPIFDIEKGCRMDTEAAQEDRSAYQTCVRDEQAAKTKIATDWSGYSIDSRATCASEQIAEFVGSYVELMTCLEIQDWKAHLDDIGPSAYLGESSPTLTHAGGYSLRGVPDVPIR
jgi:hypothetical protein